MLIWPKLAGQANNFYPFEKKHIKCDWIRSVAVHHLPGTTTAIQTLMFTCIWSKLSWFKGHACGHLKAETNQTGWWICTCHRPHSPYCMSLSNVNTFIIRQSIPWQYHTLTAMLGAYRKDLYAGCCPTYKYSICTVHSMWICELIVTSINRTYYAREIWRGCQWLGVI